MRHTFPFAKFIPGGNPTILLPEPPFLLDELPAASATLMGPMHLQAEQVGALLLPKGAGAAPRLEMMGGEFCVNATRSAAMYLARNGLLQRMDEPGVGALLAGAICVSGVDEPVAVLVSTDEDTLLQSLRQRSQQEVPAAAPCTADALPLCEALPQTRLFCAARMDCRPPGTLCAPLLSEGLSLVTMPGMSHLLVNTARHPLPDFSGGGWQQASAAWRKECGLEGLPASGVVWYEETDTGCRIWPAVAVKATQSEHMESACGSASLALAISMRQAGKLPDDVLRVTQPSGYDMLVIMCPLPRMLQSSPFAVSHAWVAGPVVLAAEGTAYI